MNGCEKIAVGDSVCLVSLKRVAGMLDISEREVYRLIESGELPKPVKIGRLSKMPVGEVVGYIERLKVARSETVLSVR
jgi:predicted DNA-binding transcriptional regulator AlpA